MHIAHLHTKIVYIAVFQLFAIVFNGCGCMQKRGEKGTTKSRPDRQTKKEDVFIIHPFFVIIPQEF